MANTMTSFRYIKRIANSLKIYWLIFGVTILLIFSLEITSKMTLLVYNYYYSHDKNDKIGYPVKGYSSKDILWLNDYNKEDILSQTLKWEPFVYWRRKPFIGKYINIDQS